MKYFPSGELNPRAVPTTNGLRVALYLSAELPANEPFKVEHQKLMIDPGAEDIYHSHKHTYELFTVENGEPIAIVNDQEISLATGDSILMEPGDLHRLCNRTEHGVVMIETRLNVHEEDRYEL